MFNSLDKTSYYSEQTFYESFIKDLKRSKTNVIIECPFITDYRFDSLKSYLSELRRKNIEVILNTRNPEEHGLMKYAESAYKAVEFSQSIGIKVLYTKKLHRKLVLIDNKILWEGSLNILSFSDSSEIMRRVESEHEVATVMKFLKYKN